MPDPEELRAIARTVIDANRFMVLGTADAGGAPWVSPVWYASAGHGEFFWVSKPGARHSRNLATRPRVSIAIFDSHEYAGWNSVHMSAVAAELTPDVERGLAIFTERSLAQGLREWTPDDVLPPARHRLYRATATELYVLSDRDERIPVTLA